ncbi:MAG: hypothetical protein ACRD2W_02325 [Acidimicrobiales bacterium]
MTTRQAPAALPRTGRGALPQPATCSAIGWGLVVAGFVGSAAANAAWGWEGAASVIYGITSLALLAAIVLLAVTQRRLSALHGGLGTRASVGIGITAFAAVLSLVAAWARHDVRDRPSGVDRLLHPVGGPLDLAVEVLVLADPRERRLVTYLPANAASGAVLDRVLDTGASHDVGRHPYLRLLGGGAA